MTQPVATDIMIYMSAQNDLSSFAEENIEAIKSCVNLDTMSVFITLDTFVNGDIGDASTRRTFKYLLPPGATACDFKRQDLPIDNRDVHSPEVFSRFLDLATLHFGEGDRRQKILVLWGHGGGMFMLDEERRRGAERARASVAEFADALVRKAHEKFPLAFDIVAFDSCYMCMIEAMHELRSATKFALCSSTLVAADGYPYDKITGELKRRGRDLAPQTSAELIAKTYNDHYREIFADGNRVLFVCDMSKIGRCVADLNALGDKLASLIVAAADDRLREAIIQALIAAGVESSYVYVLRFLRALLIILEDFVKRGELAEVGRLAKKLEVSVRSAFSGDMGDTMARPVSPLIWAPFIRNTFDLYEADYNALAASDGGRGGWVSMWREFHQLDHIRSANPAPLERRRLELPALN